MMLGKFLLWDKKSLIAFSQMPFLTLIFWWAFFFSCITPKTSLILSNSLTLGTCPQMEENDEEESEWKVPGELEFKIPPAPLEPALHFLLKSSCGTSEFTGSWVSLASVAGPGRANLCGGKQASFRRTWILLIKLATIWKSNGLPFAPPDLDGNHMPQ